MATDFRAERGRFFEIVGSGSSGSMGPGLAIFSASSANESYLPGYTDNNIFAGVGKDVFLFVSGNTSKKGIVGGGATLFGGDVIVSGTLYAEKQVIEVDESVTGSLSVSGSLMVSQSAEIHGWNGNIGPGGYGPRIGLHFTSPTGVQAVAWDGLDGIVDAAIWESHNNLHLSASKQVVILSSSIGSAGAQSLDNKNFADTNFFVSGTIGSRGTLARGTSTFGGDVHVSGNVNIGGGSLTGGPWTDEGSLLRPTDGGGVENIGVGAAGTSLGMYPAAIHGTTGDIVSNRFITASMGFSGSLTRLTDGRSYLVQGSNVTITSTSNGQVVIDATGGGTSQWTRLAGSLSPNTPSTTSVLVGSTGAGTADHVLYSDGRATFNQQKAVNGDFIVKTNTSEYGLLVKAASNQVMILSGGSPLSTHDASAADVAFYVSGAVGSQGTPVRGTSLFGGDATVSGTLHTIGSGVFNSAQAARIFVVGSGLAGKNTIHVPGSGNRPYIMFLSGGGGTSVDEARGVDVAFYVSGTKGSKGTLTKGASLFGGDVVISGSLHGGSPLKIGSNRTDLGQDVALWVSGAVGSKGTTEIGTSLFGGDTAISGTLTAHDNINSLSSFFHKGDATGLNSYSISFKAAGDALFNTNCGNNQFSVGSYNGRQAFIVYPDSSRPNIMFLSGGAAASTDETKGRDIAFYVSGTLGSQGTLDRGTSLFGGDVVISGSLKFASGSTLALPSGSGVTTSWFVVAEPSGYTPPEPPVGTIVYVTGSSADAATDIIFDVERTEITGSTHFFVDGTDGHKFEVEGPSFFSGSLFISGSSTLRVFGPSIFNSDMTGDSDVAMNTKNKRNAFFVDTSRDQILILSGGSATSANESDYSDMNFFVSGTIGSKGTLVKGSSVFGGDLVVSGGLLVRGDPSNVTHGGNISGSIHQTSRGKSYLVSGPGINIASGTNGQITITGTATSAEWTDEGSILRPNDGVGEQAGWGATGNNPALYHTLIGSGSVKTIGFISASLGLSGSHTKLVDGTSAFIAGSGITITSASNGAVTFTGTATSAEWTDEGSILRPNDGAADSLGLGATGAVESAYSILLSGSGEIKTKSHITASMGFSGSLTRLTDNTSYIKAGNGIIVTSASNGSITITSTGSSDVGWLGLTPGEIVTTGSLGIGTSLFHYGDTDTKITFSTDEIKITAGNREFVRFTESGTDVVEFNQPEAGVNFIVNNINGEMISVLAAGLVVNAGGMPNSDFRVESNQKSHAIFLDSDNQYVHFLADDATPANVGADVAFYVSGSPGSRGTAVKGTSVFGGDLLVSGVLHVSGTGAFGGASGAAIVLDSSAQSSIVWDTTPDGNSPDAQIYESNGDLVMSASDDIQIRATDNLLFYPGDALQVQEHVNASGIFASFFAQPSLNTFRNVLDIGDTGVIINDDSQSSYNFRVESNLLEGMLLVDADKNVAMVNSLKTSVAAESPGLGQDVAFYVSGTRDGINGIGGGTALMSGDLFVSGAIYEKDTSLLSLYSTDTADAGAAGTPHTEYEVFKSSYYSSGSPFSSIIPAQNTSLDVGTGVLSVNSPNHDKRFMELSFSIIFAATTGGSGAAKVKVRDNGIAGSTLYEASVFMVTNQERCFSNTIILPAGANPTLTVSGANGQVLSTFPGSTITYKNV